jgi:hypothetical protein
MSRQAQKQKTGRKESCGNAGAVESLENQPQVFHPSHRPLEISQQRRDFHIPTAPTTSHIYQNQKPYGRGASPLADKLNSSCH